MDFFLMLSGFVIAKSYGARLFTAQMSFGDYLKKRLVRLYPLALLGMMLGILKLASEALANHDQSAWGPIIKASGLNLVLVPYWSATPFRGESFPTDPPVWSLFAELVLNIAWGALAIAWSGRILMTAIAVISGAISLFYVWNYGISIIEYGQTIAPITRAVFAFSLGIIFCNLEGGIVALKVPAFLRHPFVLSVLLMLVLGVQTFGYGWDALAIYVFLPAIIVCGIAAGSEQEGGVRKLLGDISYPLYVVHFPIFLLISGFCHKFAPGVPTSLAVASGIVAALVTSYIANKYYDVPVRAYLNRTHAAVGGAVAQG